MPADNRFVRIVKTGNWTGIFRMVAHLPTDIMGGMRDTVRHMTLDAEKRALKHMRDQDLNWIQYRNPNYAAQKDKRGESTKLLIATSTYFQSITTIIKKDVGFVGVVKGDRDQKNGQPLTTIAAVHEFGSERQNIVARPLWRPTLQETVKEVRRTKMAQNKVKSRLLKRLR